MRGKGEKEEEKKEEEKKQEVEQEEEEQEQEEGKERLEQEGRYHRPQKEKKNPGQDLSGVA